MSLRPVPVCLALCAALLLGTAACMPPQWGANAILHPYRRPVTRTPSHAYDNLYFAGDGLVLKGWRVRTYMPRRGVIIYLHGIGDNRQSSLGLVSRFVPKGYDVIAYDSRGHGTSQGDTCTYGVYERRDLKSVIDSLREEHVILFGVSLGAAVALQEAADDPRVIGVVSVATFSDLRTVARDRAPFFASEGNIRDAFTLAEAQGKFRVDDASPIVAAPRIRVPVLLFHGAADTDTKPAHSQRVHDALGGPKKLALVPRAEHNDVLNHEWVWDAISDWLDQVVMAPATP
ncbi:MAG: alpha/beta fold hydrolase [Deltaproteobacteria bacterium]|nr:alpha/beta fold hydrolase [Deltaproteobacteria bacterium]